MRKKKTFMLSFNFEGWLETLNCPNVSVWINGVCVLLCLASPWLQIAGLDSITLVSTDADGHLTWFRLPPTVVKRCLLFSFWRWSGLWRSSSLCCSTLTWDCWHPWCSPCSLSSSGRSCRNTCRTLNKHYRGQPKSGPAPPANWPKPQNSLILWFKSPTCNFFSV